MKLIADINECYIADWETNTGEVNARVLEVEMCEDLCSCASAFVQYELADGTKYISKITDGKADIPPFEKSQFVKIGVYSTDIDGDVCTKRYSPRPVSVFVPAGSYSGNGTEAPTPTAGTFEELLETINNKLDVSKVVGYDTETEFSPDTVFSTEAIFAIVEYIDFMLKGLAEEKESKANKVTEIDENSTDEQYASAKAVVDYVDEKTIKTLEGANVWKLEAGAYFVNGNVLYATPDPPASPNTIFLNGEKCLLIVTVDPMENNKRYFYLFAKGKIYFGYSKSNGVFGDVELTEGAINGEFAKVTNIITAKNPDEIPSTEAVINYVDTTIGGIENGSY